jgi:hypothetical protein
MGSMARDTLRSAAERLSATAEQIRETATGLLGHQEERNGRSGAEVAADALRSASHSIEVAAAGIRRSGLVLGDRGRDASRALARGERVLRQGGFREAGLRTAVRARRNAGRLLLTGAGVLVVLLLRSRIESRADRD